MFVAIEVGPGSGSPTTAPEHLTLSFLGDVAPESVDRVLAALDRVARASRPFDLVIEGVGAFPSARHPRVVWVGATTGGAETSELAERVAAALVEQRILPPGGERFVPHVTLFRVRSPELHRRARALLSGTEPGPAPRALRVSEIVLKESTLSSEGAVHRTRATFRLGASGGPTA